MVPLNDGMRANPSLERRQISQEQLGTEAREQESGIVRREQANHLLPQQLLHAVTKQPASPMADSGAGTGSGSPVPDPRHAEFQGEFWDTAPHHDPSEAELDFEAAPEANVRPPISYTAPRRIGATLAFALVFSATMLLLLGEVVFWLLKHS